jgi:hypothetical protein
VLDLPLEVPHPFDEARVTWQSGSDPADCLRSLISVKFPKPEGHGVGKLPQSPLQRENAPLVRDSQLGQLVASAEVSLIWGKCWKEQRLDQGRGSAYFGVDFSAGN